MAKLKGFLTARKRSRRYALQQALEKTQVVFQRLANLIIVARVLPIWPVEMRDARAQRKPLI